MPGFGGNGSTAFVPSAVSASEALSAPSLWKLARRINGTLKRMRCAGKGDRERKGTAQSRAIAFSSTQPRYRGRRSETNCN
jgi:hypothetical protein